MATSMFAGPVNYVVFSLPEDAPIGAGLRAVLDSATYGVVDILDIEVIALGEHGRPVLLQLKDLVHTVGVDLSDFAGMESGLLSKQDLADISFELEREMFALVIVYEDRSLASAAEMFTRVGGVEIFSGGVDIADLGEALEGEDAS